ncbi:carbon-nitrogen hydrolase [Pisolithus orientalis]|uniref:carbon-nitrogen hydrolase n=1 Tax=Pisolithus orientalis TaxID=936130 RepID=UPI00222504FE|nr:carbon-nitrogen hydrolase [Pisolithus orientalis]KAI6028292.1 carbon-nitrogen hydrolase [Pisolithus orientalis]
MVLKVAGGDGSAGSKPSLVVLPECFNSPYGRVSKYAETIGFTKADDIEVQTCQSESVRMLSSAAKEANIWLVGGDADNKFYKTCTVYSPTGKFISVFVAPTLTCDILPGALVAMHRKVHLFDIDIPGKITLKESKMISGGSSMNFFDTEFARIGLGICHDVRFPELAMISARRGCHMLIYPGAFNLTTGPLHWSLLQRARYERASPQEVFPARDMSARYHAWGHSMVVDPFGKILAEAEEGESVVQVSIDPTVLYDARAGIPVTTQRRFDVYPDVSSAQ